ncbi:hypothetical protein EJ06DRAFT_26253 [Trichodelitschia bisporula]|uniref:Uncharacterized protein n=1 Tax=Trichodelitschia bisporula TaxID=703511 RepID=A0A6G1IB67_9PEZI|nr:hypothetical protein EJ06DRAFT_26253 [Trichodelitschia bisporula]
MLPVHPRPISRGPADLKNPIASGRPATPTETTPVPVPNPAPSTWTPIHSNPILIPKKLTEERGRAEREGSGDSLYDEPTVPKRQPSPTRTAPLPAKKPALTWAPIHSNPIPIRRVRWKGDPEDLPEERRRAEREGSGDISKDEPPVPKRKPTLTKPPLHPASRPAPLSPFLSRTNIAIGRSKATAPALDTGPPYRTSKFPRPPPEPDNPLQESCAIESESEVEWVDDSESDNSEHGSSEDAPSEAITSGTLSLGYLERRPVKQGPVLRTPLPRTPVLRRRFPRSPFPRSPFTRSPVLRRPVSRKPALPHPFQRQPVQSRPIPLAVGPGSASPEGFPPDLVAPGVPLFPGAQQPAILRYAPLDSYMITTAQRGLDPLVGTHRVSQWVPDPVRDSPDERRISHWFSTQDRDSQDERSRQARRDSVPSERAPSERAPSERAPSERAPSERVPSEHVPSERGPSERGPSSERLPSERATSEHPPSERPLLERPPSERAPSERALSERIPSVPAQPVPAKPVPASPVPTQPVPTQPVPTSPVPAPPVAVPAPPVAVPPVPTQPVPTQPVPTQPVPTEPVSASPVPAQPVPVPPPSRADRTKGVLRAMRKGVLCIIDPCGCCLRSTATDEERILVDDSNEGSQGAEGGGGRSPEPHTGTTTSFDQT